MLAIGTEGADGQQSYWSPFAPLGDLDVQSWSAEQTIDTKCRRPSSQDVERAPCLHGSSEVSSSNSAPLFGMHASSKGVDLPLNYTHSSRDLRKWESTDTLPG